MDGALVLDKPEGVTSHDGVQAARRLLSQRRIGHLGTLDPFATGVLVLLVGQATRLARFYREREKTYQGVIRFGYATDTMDRTGQPVGPVSDAAPQEGELRRAFAAFTGAQAQQPPAYSAKKVSGVPAHRLARKGTPVELMPVAVVIHSLELVALDGPLAQFETRVSSGTYIRSLVNDLGVRLGIGAHLAELRRTRLGEFGEQVAVSLDRLEELVREGTSAVIPMEVLLPEIPSVTLTASDARRAQNGCDLELDSEAERLRLWEPGGRLCGIAERLAERLYHPAVVLVGEQRGPAAPPQPEASGVPEAYPR